jgi:phage repressor protein C with HTH and peptisase S24 domain
MKTLADRLKSTREDRRLSQQALADRASRLGRKVRQQVIADLETGKTNRSTAISEIAAALGVNALWLTEGRGVKTADEAIPEAKIEKVPRVAMVRAGAFTDTVPISGFDDLPTEKAVDLPPGEWIAFMVEGDSMDRISPPGSIIFVNRKERQLLDNKLYVVVTEQGEATYKRYRSSPPRLEPVSSNPEHEAIFPDGRLKVVGRVRRSVYDIQ